jgi:hypothetical protein
MDVRAILVVAADERERGERFAGAPLAMLDLVGKSLVEHTSDRLRRFGVEEIAVVCERQLPNPAHVISPNSARRLMVEGENLWNACQSVFNDFAQGGAEVVLVERLGPYLEVNFEHFVQFHLDCRAHVSLVSEGDRSLNLVAISASRRNDAAFLFRSHLKEFRVMPARYAFDGYSNPMRGSSDLRHLTCDVLMQRTQLTPAGHEMRPGIWMGRGARIERGARVVAPAYLGAGARIRSAALVTRASSVGQHAEIDCGTIVDASNVLPFTYVGAALELTNCVAGFNRLVSLDRKAEVDIADGKLLNVRSAKASRRAIESAALFARSLPLEIFHSIFARRDYPPPLGTGDGVASSALGGATEVERKRKARDSVPPSSPAFENQLIGVRRYSGER